MSYKGSKPSPKFHVVPNKRNAFVIMDKSGKRPKIKTVKRSQSEADDWVREHTD